MASAIGVDEGRAMNAVEFESVSYTYPGAATPAIDDLTLALPEGSFVLVTGATGAGKSTFIRAINGLVPHFSGGEFSGRVLTQSRNTLECAPRDLADVVAFVPQDSAAAFVVDRVEDEIAYSLENLGVDRSVMRRRVEETLDLLNLESLRDRSVRTLSGGECQRVTIAAALAPGPRILLLDEPTSQLDPQGAEDVLAALQRLVHDIGITVVIAEHRLERVAGFVDVAVGLEPGAPALVGEPATVLAATGGGPPVTRLGRLVGWDPAPLTVRDARRMVGSKAPAASSPRRSRLADFHRPLVSARRIVAGYGERTVLKGVDASLACGEIVALMGRNGAGKTTLLRCLAGLHRLGAGEVDADGGPPVAGRSVALCPQRPESVLFADRVADELGATLRATGSRVSIDELLTSLGIAELRDHHPRDLSAGQRLLVAVGAIVATGAPALLLDEPTRGLDPASKTQLVSFLRSWVSGERGVMIATHDVEFAAEVATSVVMIAGGEIIAEGTPAEVLGDSPVFAPQMARVFGPGWLTPEQVAGALVAAGRAWPDRRTNAGWARPDRRANAGDGS
ncbi:MAG: ABC transporter ATP-binding protein [Actinomycetota bacterium]